MRKHLGVIAAAKFLGVVGDSSTHFNSFCGGKERIKTTEIFNNKHSN